MTLFLLPLLIIPFSISLYYFRQTEGMPILRQFAVSFHGILFCSTYVIGNTVYSKYAPSYYEGWWIGGLPLVWIAACASAFLALTWLPELRWKRLLQTLNILTGTVIFLIGNWLLNPSVP